MNGKAEPVNRVGSTAVHSLGDYATPISVSLRNSGQRFGDWLLLSLKAIVEYSFGMYIGAALGWLLGWWAGDLYVGHFKPVYCSSFAELNEIVQWSCSLPYECAGFGRLIGAVLGAITIMLVNRHLLNEKIIALCEDEAAEPADIARALGENLHPIERRVSKLAKKGRIQTAHQDAN